MLLAQSRAQHLRRQSSNSQEAVDSEQCLSFCLSVLDGKVLFFFSLVGDMMSTRYSQRDRLLVRSEKV